jgi:hypothetical protein
MLLLKRLTLKNLSKQERSVSGSECGALYKLEELPECSRPRCDVTAETQADIFTAHESCHALPVGAACAPAVALPCKCLKHDAHAH